eukprot:TRINITY_DN3946_c0_g1_i2.p1 TRINITY_DN3946_c0_g1~~TRINITY_DN3946_c0_g1_i2.p1  ORF type:complete len:552 (+),score=85.30 TRINITY_DN3946_c0_g1_i2:112-1767(+)
MGNQSPKRERRPYDADENASYSLEYVCGDKGDLNHKYEIGDVLGTGSFGVVRTATLRAGSQQVRAVKIVKRCGDADDPWSEIAMIRAEAIFLGHLDHPNIVRVWDSYEDDDDIYMVMDLCSGGEVFNKLLEVKRFSERRAAGMAIQILAAIEYLHNNRIMHRDVKAENFLLVDDSCSPVLKLIDFGFACRFSRNSVYRDVCGSMAYMSPELLQRRYNHTVDVWAIGVLVYLLLFGQYPYRSKVKKELLQEILSKEPSWKRKGVTDISIDFIQMLLSVDPAQRATCEEALQHPFMGKREEAAEVQLQRRSDSTPGSVATTAATPGLSPQGRRASKQREKKREGDEALQHPFMGKREEAAEVQLQRRSDSTPGSVATTAATPGLSPQGRRASKQREKKREGDDTEPASPASPKNHLQQKLDPLSPKPSRRKKEVPGETADGSPEKPQGSAQEAASTDSKHVKLQAVNLQTHNGCHKGSKPGGDTRTFAFTAPVLPGEVAASSSADPSRYAGNGNSSGSSSLTRGKASYRKPFLPPTGNPASLACPEFTPSPET